MSDELNDLLREVSRDFAGDHVNADVVLGAVRRKLDALAAAPSSVRGGGDGASDIRDWLESPAANEWYAEQLARESGVYEDGRAFQELTPRVRRMWCDTAGAEIDRFLKLAEHFYEEAPDAAA